MRTRKRMRMPLPQRSAAGHRFHVAVRAAHPVATLLEDDASRRVLPLRFSDSLSEESMVSHVRSCTGPCGTASSRWQRPSLSTISDKTIPTVLNAAPDRHKMAGRPNRQ
ncbi:hypothetical protein Landi51_04935 [Colletotrichum acutatum]